MVQLGPTALPPTCCAPRLWPGQVVYVRPSLRLDAHSGSVACLAIAVNGTFTIRADGSTGPARSQRADPASVQPPGRRRCRRDGVLLPRPRLGAARRLPPRNDRHKGADRHRHRREAALAEAASGLTDGETAHAGWTWPPHRGRSDAAGLTDPRVRDAITAPPRAARVVGYGPRRPRGAVTVTVPASVSDHTGTSFRRYRLWLRMLRATELLPHRPDLITAARDAGFASSSHFSDAFHAMFGLRPRHLLGTEINLALTASKTA